VPGIVSCTSFLTSKRPADTGDTLDGVRQLILSPRWILWHLLTLGAVATCLWLAAWQWQRAGSAMGSALNIGYGLQWPLFAVFFAIMWWRFLRMEIVQLRSTEPAEPRPEKSTRQPEPVRAPLHGPNPFGPRPADARPAPIDEDSALAAYNRMLAELAARNQKD
jgi:DNA-binding transcriptional regulator of glucitol operon